MDAFSWASPSVIPMISLRSRITQGDAGIASLAGPKAGGRTTSGPDRSVQGPVGDMSRRILARVSVQASGADGLGFWVWGRQGGWVTCAPRTRALVPGRMARAGSVRLGAGTSSALRRRVQCWCPPSPTHRAWVPMPQAWALTGPRGPSPPWVRATVGGVSRPPSGPSELHRHKDLAER